MAHRSLVVVTPWYPDSGHPFAGIFVQHTVEALALNGPTPSVVHVHNVHPEEVTDPVREVRDGIDVLRIPVSTPAGTSRAQMGRNQREALRTHASALLRRAAAVHVHVAIPTGWAVLDLLDDAQDLVVTEHATYVRRELTHAEGLQMYTDVVARARAVLAVSEGEAARIRGSVPNAREKVVSLGNPVRDAVLPLRSDVPQHLDRWLYVGTFVKRKGLIPLLHAFALWREERPDSHLTLVGSGTPEEVAALQELMTELNVREAVSISEPVPPDELVNRFAEADVLVHLASFETFGLTVVEAAMTGLPVLVSYSGGPQETLAEAAAAGLVRFSKTRSARVRAAMLELEATQRMADRAAVRAQLVDKYGEQAFGARLRAILDGAPAWTRATGPHLLAVATSQRGLQRARSLMDNAIRTNTRLTVLTNQHSVARAIDPRIDVIDVSGDIARHPLHLPETIFVQALPKRALGLIDRALAAAGRLPGPLGAQSPRARRLLQRLSRKHQRLAHAIRHRVLHRFVYAFLDPWLFAKRWERAVIERVELDHLDGLVITDHDARPLIWRLGQRLPTVPITWVPSLDELRGLASSRSADPNART